ncbi:tetratricopeptide repeat protein 38 family protein [Marinobacterium nitratireducens]|uniref:Tetratricopeptide repeat protein 38 n=1 Tax=Marinobacterium nitratireducens TaxID=518897 RepID=A0A918DNM2_9GAMM|nr:tetratricopeptide repeat protein [Marinobacterium nitratireducens]GGO77135.1 tetratricopeptide repeat protein 38 family protein [Marinobacterium nitratireducens]
MNCDLQGHPLSGASLAAVEDYEAAVRAFNIYRGDPVALIDSAIEQAPEFSMALLLKAWLYAVATEPEANVAAQGFVDRLDGLSLNEREASLAGALRPLLAGNWTESAQRLDLHSARYPLDIVALQCGHLLDFYRASARDLRDRIHRALPKWSASVPGYSIVLGMRAFGLEECGDYGRAEAVGREAVALEPLDCWAHHAVAHVMEMQGRAEDGIGWMTTREPCWSGDDNFFRVHNWWHSALYHLDLGRVDEAVALYDGPVREDRSKVALDMVDGSALLWRLSMLGVEVGNRWQELADTWDLHADGRLYPFNDWHAVMAYLGAGRDRDVDRILSALRTANGNQPDVTRWARETGLPLVEGFVAFWRGDYALSAELLHNARYIANSFGGSHAQRDIIDWTLTEAALRGGLRDLAEAMSNERLALKPHSRINIGFSARVKQMTAA